MITDRGTVVVKANIDKRARRELTKPLLIFSILCWVFGGFFFVVSIVLAILDSDGEFTDKSLFLMFGILLCSCGTIMFSVRRGEFKQDEVRNQTDETEFFGTYLINKEYREGEHVATAKVYYRWLYRTKETANFLFFYISQYGVVVVDKSSISPEEICILRGLTLGNETVMPPAAPPVQGAEGGSAAGEEVASAAEEPAKEEPSVSDDGENKD